MSFEDEINHTSQEMGGSDFYKWKEGDNKIQILTEPQIQVSRYGYGICYEGAPYCQKDQIEAEYEEAVEKAKAEGKDPKKVSRATLTKRWMCWAIDRFTGNMVILTMPYGVSKTIAEMKKSEEAGFEGWPMPYGLNIKVTNPGKKEVEYEVIASRKNTAITEAEFADLDKKKPIEQILERMKEKQQAKYEGITPAKTVAHEEESYEPEEINPSDIPF